MAKLFVCDHCGVQIGGSRWVLIWEAGSTRRELDLCWEHYEEFTTMLRNIGQKND